MKRPFEKYEFDPPAKRTEESKSEEKWEFSRGGEKWSAPSTPPSYSQRWWVFPLGPRCFQSSQTCRRLWNFHTLWNAQLEPQFFFFQLKGSEHSLRVTREGLTAQGMIHTSEVIFLRHVQTDPTAAEMSRRMLIRQVSQCFCVELWDKKSSSVENKWKFLVQFSHKCPWISFRFFSFLF